MAETTCPGSGCTDGPMVDGLCLGHYVGPLLASAGAFKPRTRAPVIVRFLHYTDMSGGPASCWPYTNSVHPAGFATFFDDSSEPKLQKAHRWAYAHFIGPIPEGTDITHTCCTEDCLAPGWGDPHHACVNPRHLAIAQESKRNIYTCARCGKAHTKDRPIKGATAFCSTKCRSGWHMVTKMCPVCGKTFSVPRSNDDRYQTCSWACKNVDTVYINCERCGKRFPDDTRQRWHRHYCSEACRRPPLMTPCHNCGKEFRTHEGDVNRRFCSIPCVRQFMGETRLEARVRVALEALGVGFTQEYPFRRRWSIDFAIPMHRIAIEADGDYWHTILADRDAKRDRIMNDAGWTVVRLAESHVNNAIDLGQLILSRIHEATGLGLSDLIGPAIRGTRRRLGRRDHAGST